MKITDIKIKNYKAFYCNDSEYTISLDRKNLLIYGENGSGKSSLYSALIEFFEASHQEKKLIENIFIDESEKGNAFIELSFKKIGRKAEKEIVRWDNKDNKKIVNSLVEDTNKIKGFFDYRKLLKTHFIEKSEEIDLFDLMIDEILYYSINDFTKNSFGEEWKEIKELGESDRRGTGYRNELQPLIDGFNMGLHQKLNSIEKKTNEILIYFGYDIEISFDLTQIGTAINKKIKNSIDKGKIYLGIKFHGKDIKSHHTFLNEARLTAVGVSLYLASILDNPMEEKFKILVLDDVLIGLDTGNRIPFIRVLIDHFEEFQIILTTYDKTWFELLKSYFEVKQWNFIEMYSKKLVEGGCEIPVIYDNQDFIVKAETYLEQNDYKASSVYIRSEFEKLIKNYCHKKHLKVKYDKQAFKVDSNSFWIAIKEQKKYLRI